MKKILLLLLLSIPLTSRALADAPVDRSFYEGVVPNGYIAIQDLSKWVKVSDSCNAKITQLLGSLIDYQKAAFLNRDVKNDHPGGKSFTDDSPGLKELFPVIQTELESFKSEGEVCQNAGTIVYLMGAVSLLEPRQLRVMPIIVHDLFTHGHIQLLTPDLRGNLQGLWAKKDKNNYYIMGAEDCSQDIIWIDPTLAPFNLGATLFHELDHLFRDKLGTKPGQWSLKEWVMFDETMASSMSAFVQKRMSTPNSNENIFDFDADLMTQFYNTNPKRSLFFGYYGQSNRYFDVTGDLNLYSRSGHLQRMLTTEMNLFEGAQAFFYHSGLMRCSDGADVNFWSKASDPLAIYDIVSENYFSEHLSSQEQQTLLPPYMISLSGPARWPPCVDLDPLIAVLGLNEGLRATDDVNIERLFPLLDLLHEQLGTETNLCHEFEDGVASTDMKKYLGGKIRVGAEGGKPATPVTPGAEGGKPGTPIKPGAEGGKPQLPVKPSADVRPCLYPDQKL